MDVILIPLIHVIGYVIYLYGWVVIITVAMSWLVQFNILNTRQRAVYMIMDVLHRVTEPALLRLGAYCPIWAVSTFRRSSSSSSCSSCRKSCSASP